MNKIIRKFMWMASGLLFAGVAVLAGCTITGTGQEPLPTLFVIPTLTPSVTPSLTLFISPTATVPTTPTLTETPPVTATPLIGATSTPSGGAAPAPGNVNIQYFTPTPTEVNPGGSVTLAWASTGATQATIFRVNATGGFGESWQVDTTGTLTVSAVGAGESENFVLRVSDGVNIREAETTIKVACTRSWFFTESRPSSCPATAEVSTIGAEQDFERGWAYWMETTGKVYILYEDGQSPSWEVYTDTWSSSEPETDSSLTAPSGLLQPRRGIGKVWRTNSTVKDRLGWALSDEIGYTATFQQEGGSDPDNIFFTEPAAQVVRLESGGSSWRFGEVAP